MGTRHHPDLLGIPYFVTGTTRNRLPIFAQRGAAELLISHVSSLRDQLGFALLSFVVMPEHLHAVFVPGAATPLGRIMQGVKGGFAREWNLRTGSNGSIWQARYFESGVRTEAQLNRWIEYIEMNPVKAGLAEVADSYPYSSAGRGEVTDLEDYLAGGLWTGDAGLKPGLRNGGHRS